MSETDTAEATEVLDSVEITAPQEGLSDFFGRDSGSRKIGEDATATHKSEDVEPAHIETVLEPEKSEEIIEPVDESQQEVIDPQDFEALFKAEQVKNENLEKRNRDAQSFNDSRFNDFDKRLNEMTNQPPPEPKEEVKEYSKQELSDLIYEDPEAAMLYVAQKNGLTQATQPQQPINIDMDIKEAVQRELNPDYDVVVQGLIGAAHLHPEIIQEVQNASNPAKAAYEAGKKIQANLELGKDPAAYEEKLRAKWEAEQLADKDKPKQRQGLHGVRSAQPSTDAKKKKGPVGSTGGLSAFFTNQAGSRTK
jgi:hypothetical protein